MVAPSLLLCDFGHLADEVKRLEDAGVQALHLDVMDGQFVPNLTYGMPIVEAVRRATELPIETHLMIADPGRYLDRFIAAGADAITFHVEAVADPRPLLEKLRAQDILAGLAYNPDTPLAAVQPYLDAADLLLTMSVSPGFGGQAFETVALERVATLGKQAPEAILEIDGGINSKTIGSAAAAGTQFYVVGSAIFHTADYTQSVAQLTQLAQSQYRTR